jgi:hypothetical protein
MGQEAAPGRGEFDRARVADDQPLTENLFQAGNAVRKALLGQVQLPRRAPEMQRVGGGDERLDLVEVKAHGSTLTDKDPLIQPQRLLLDPAVPK